MTRPSPRKVGKALPPVYAVVYPGTVKIRSLYESKVCADLDALICNGSVAKYVPSLPRKAGARRAR